MYSPGPVNLIGFNEGIKGNFRQSIRFFAGVGAAMLILCILLGYTGELLVPVAALPYIAMLGCAYILYLAFKIFRSMVNLELDQGSSADLTFRDGFFIQMLNPKAMLALVPITTIQFPAAEITGVKILVFSTIIGVLAMWAPGSYSYIGEFAGKRLYAKKYMKILNISMSLLLALAAILMFYENVLKIFV